MKRIKMSLNKLNELSVENQTQPNKRLSFNSVCTRTQPVFDEYVCFTRVNPGRSLINNSM